MLAKRVPESNHLYLMHSRSPTTRAAFALYNDTQPVVYIPARRGFKRSAHSFWWHDETSKSLVNTDWYDDFLIGDTWPVFMHLQHKS